jgi:hypothetical protein
MNLFATFFLFILCWNLVAEMSDEKVNFNMSLRRMGDVKVNVEFSTSDLHGIEQLALRSGHFNHRK